LKSRSVKAEHQKKKGKTSQRGGDKNPKKEGKPGNKSTTVENKTYGNKEKGVKVPSPPKQSSPKYPKRKG